MASHSRLKHPAKHASDVEKWTDLLDDWPHITVQTLSTRSPSQNLQLRIKAVEWSLFRLYELYDAQNARDKLRPFFPPQSQLQSQNLRAALLRVLTDLKKTGVLEKDVVLRKTIFDECKGEKFEELLAGFASIVLEQRIQLNNSAISAVSRTSQDNVLPLILAYRRSVQENLQSRRALREKLLKHEQEATRRSEAVSRVKKSLRHHNSKGSAVREQVAHSLRESWAAGPVWADALLHGFPPGKSLLQEDCGSTNSHSPTRKLQEIQDLTTDETARLQRWASFRSCLSTLTGESTDRTRFGSPRSTGIKFGKHQGLLLREAKEPTPDDDHDISDACRRHHDLLRRLREALQPVHCQVPNSAVAATASPAFETRERISTTVTFSTKNDTKPRADSKQHSQSSEQDSYGDAPPTAALVPFTSHCETDEPSVALHSSPHIQASSSKSTWFPATHTLPTFGPSHAPESPPVSEGDAESAIGSSPPVTPMPVSRPNLQERTRMSLAGALRDLTNAPDSPRVHENKLSMPDRDTLSPVHASSTSDLAQRTRKSMFLLTTLSEMKTARRVSRGPRTSQLYPVNPFETPRKSSLHLDVHTPDTGESTPRERLFSEDADMSSVFKSRPKIALSPMMSPDRSLLEEDSILASQADAINLDQESDTASPTHG